MDKYMVLSVVIFIKIFNLDQLKGIINIVIKQPKR